jgi:hypothetical protein
VLERRLALADRAGEAQVAVDAEALVGLVGRQLGAGLGRLDAGQVEAAALADRRRGRLADLANTGGMKR